MRIHQHIKQIRFKHSIARIKLNSAFQKSKIAPVFYFSDHSFLRIQHLNNYSYLSLKFEQLKFNLKSANMHAQKHIIN